MRFIIKKRLKGVTIIEALIALAIFSIIVMSFYLVLTQGLSYIILSRDKLQAIAVANQEMEKMRNLAYEDVALIGGIPSGILNPEDVINFGNKNFLIQREVFFIDDAEDSLFPTDIVPNDYKIVKVTVQWADESEIKQVEFRSRFVPQGLEGDEDGGFLSINVVDYSGTPVPDVNVHLFNDDVSPTVNLNTETNDSGNLLIQGAPADAESYEITLTKSGYETVQTYPPHPHGPFAPVDEHATVVEATLNEKTLVMNELSDIEVITVDPFNNEISEVNYDLEGGRRLNTDEPPVYNFSDSVESDSNGKVELDDVSGGTYAVELDPSENDYVFWKMNPHDDEKNQFDVTPGDNVNIDMIVLLNDFDAIFVYVEDKTEKDPIEGASVTVTNETLGYDVTILTDKYGYAYFPENETDILQNGVEYDIEVTADGYDDEIDSVIVDGLEEMDFKLK